MDHHFNVSVQCHFQRTTWLPIITWLPLILFCCCFTETKQSQIPSLARTNLANEADSDSINILSLFRKVTGNIVLIFVHTAAAEHDWISRKLAWQRRLGGKWAGTHQREPWIIGRDSTPCTRSPPGLITEIQRKWEKKKKRIKRERGCVSTGLRANIARTDGACLAPGSYRFCEGVISADTLSSWYFLMAKRSSAWSALWGRDTFNTWVIAAPAMRR